MMRLQLYNRPFMFLDFEVLEYEVVCWTRCCVHVEKPEIFGTNSYRYLPIDVAFSFVPLFLRTPSQ